jgi:hypothetical protein
LSTDIYWTVFKTDRLLSKSLVWFLFIADTFQSILLANDGFLIFGANFMNQVALNETHLVWLSVPTLTGVGVYCALFGVPNLTNITTAFSELRCSNIFCISDILALGQIALRAHTHCHCMYLRIIKVYDAPDSASLHSIRRLHLLKALLPLWLVQKTSKFASILSFKAKHA